MEDGTQIRKEEGEPAAPRPGTPEFSVQPSYVRTVFLGPGGLRAGWGVAFYLAMQHLLSRWISFLDVGGSELWSMTVQEGGQLVAAVVPALVMARVERQRWGSYGLPGRQAFGKLFWVGGVWGFASISVLLGLIYGLHGFEVRSLAIHGVRILRFGVFWAGFFLLVGLFEEFHFRGYMQFALTRGIGFWPAAFALSSYFGWSHRTNEGEAGAGLLAAAVIGLFFCLTLRRTGSLWFAVGFHTAWDWGETFFYSVPDSGSVFPGHLLKSAFHGPAWLTGGTIGPEGSVLCFLVIGLAWAVFAKTHPEAKYGVRSSE